jgi:hypothetical protein
VTLAEAGIQLFPLRRVPFLGDRSPQPLAAIAVKWFNVLAKVQRVGLVRTAFSHTLKHMKSKTYYYYQFWLQSSRGTDAAIMRRYEIKPDKDQLKQDVEDWCEKFGAWHVSENHLSYGWRPVKPPKTREACIAKHQEACKHKQKWSDKARLYAGFLQYLSIALLCVIMTGCVTKRPQGLRPIPVNAQLEKDKKALIAKQRVAMKLLAPKLTFVSTNILTDCQWSGPASVTLAWCPCSVPTNNGVSGYRLYYNTGGTTNYVQSTYSPTNPCGPVVTAGTNYLRAYTNTLWAGTNLTYTVSNMTPSIKYSFAVTCVDTNGLESDFSDELQFTVPAWRKLTNSFPIYLTALGTNTYQISCKVCPNSKLTLLTKPIITQPTWSIVATNITPDAYGNVNYRHTNTNRVSFYRAYLQ